MQISKYITRGFKNTLKLLNGTQFSYAGPWVNLIKEQAIDTWHVGDFMSADYTISVDKNTYSKEILKCVIAAGPENASVTIYGRTSLEVPLINLRAEVTNSIVTLYATPVSGNCKVLFSANYYYTINPISTSN